MRTARYSLKKQGYIDEVSKFTYQNTEEGLELLNDSAEDIVNEIEELLIHLILLRKKLKKLKVI